MGSFLLGGCWGRFWLLSRSVIQAVAVLLVCCGVVYCDLVDGPVLFKPASRRQLLSSHIGRVCRLTQEERCVRSGGIE